MAGPVIGMFGKRGAEVAPAQVWICGSIATLLGALNAGEAPIQSNTADKARQ